MTETFVKTIPVGDNRFMAGSDLAATFFSCLVPSALFLAFIRTRVRREPGSWRPLALAFVLGMVAAATAFFLFENLESLRVYGPLISGLSGDDLERAAFFLAVVGPIEECLKLAVVVVVTTLFGPLRTPTDGVVTVSASALGFATAENWYAMWATGGLDPGRAAVVPFLHMLFSSLSGWGLGESVRRRRSSGPVYAGLALASLYHGLYNYLTVKGGVWYFASLPIVALMWFFLVRTLAAFSKEPWSLRRS